MFDAEEVGFVICSKCGAQIRADREWCLRCHEPLVAWKKQEIPLPSWIQALGGGTLIFGTVGVVAAGVLLYLSLGSGSSGPDRPVARASTPATAAASGTPAAVAAARTQGPPRIQQVMFVDAPRRANMETADADLAATRTRLEQAVQQDPKNAETMNSLGLALERLGFVASALARYSAAVELDRGNWLFHFNLAHAASLQQNWNRAAQEYSAAVELFPANFAAQYDMAIALHMASNEPEAVKAYQKAIELAPGDPASHLSLAISLEAAGRSDEAVSEFRRYLQMVPTAQDAPAVTSRIQSLTHES